MQPFTTLTAIAAPLPMINIDTDMIIPKQFLRTIKRTGLGINLFNDMRYDENGNEKPDFVLNQEPYRKAGILIAGKNFGCGSSREHAPWALLDFGINCVIAPGFADIFFNNCLKNGILPVVLEQEAVDALIEEVTKNPENQVAVDLGAQTVHIADRFNEEFQMEAFRKHCLLNGLDDISLTMEKETLIENYETANKEARSWLWQ